MPARRPTVPAAAAALIVGLATLATPALAAGPAPAPTDPPAATVAIEDGPFAYSPRELGIALRYSCYGDPTTINVTVTAGTAKATGSKAITCEGETELPVGLGVTVPDDAPVFPPGVNEVEVRVSIPGQASEDYELQFEGAPTLEEVNFSVVVDASPKEVVKGKKITVTAGIFRGGASLPFAAKTALEFRPDGGDWRKVKSVTSEIKSVTSTLKTKVEATKSGNYRFRYAGSSESAPATSSAVHVVVRPKPKAYKSCKALTEVYKHGVGKNGATEVGLGLTNWTWSTPTYKKNKKFDSDHDGVACEKV